MGHGGGGDSEVSGTDGRIEREEKVSIKEDVDNVPADARGDDVDLDGR